MASFAVPSLTLLIIITALTFCSLLSQSQGKRSWVHDYPFIKSASSFSSAASFSGGGAAGGYDYIIAGGGTAACPLAATLSRNFTVLVLERGGVPFSNPNVSFLANFHIALADTSPASASQAFVSTDGVLNARARVLGGGSCINAGFYSRANRRFIERMGWDEKLVNESYPWVEKQIVHWPKFAPWQRVLRDSLLDLGIKSYNGFTYDHVEGTKVGGTIYDRFGRRHTAAELLVTGNPDKLTVLIHATVQKVLFDTSGKKPKAVGVIFMDEKGTMHQAFLTNNPRSEIILSCGAIGTPQMLILSGIGPERQIKDLNISVVLKNEFVGQGMSDNPMNTIFVPTKEPVEQSLIQTVGIITKMGVYIEGSSGFGMTNDSIQCDHGIMSAEIGQLPTLPPEKRTPHAIQAFLKAKPYEAFRGGFVLEKLANPLSFGHLELVNVNVDDNPNVTFNYFSDPRDLKTCVRAIRLAADLVRSIRFQNFTGYNETSLEKILKRSVEANVNLIPKNVNDTTSLEQFCRDTVTTIWHYHGGCHVGRVVSPDFKVLGVDRLRIVDGSTFRESPGTNPQATVMMMGRYMGVWLLRNRLGREAGV